MDTYYNNDSPREFRIYSTGCIKEDMSLFNIYPDLKKFEHSVNKNGVFIVLNNLGHLHDLIKLCGHPVIIDDHDYEGNNTPTIEIYDDYRE